MTQLSYQLRRAAYLIAVCRNPKRQKRKNATCFVCAELIHNPRFDIAGSTNLKQCTWANYLGMTNSKDFSICRVLLKPFIDVGVL